MNIARAILKPSFCFADILSDATLVFAEECKIKVHRHYGRRTRNHGKLNLLESLRMKFANQLVAVVHTPYVKWTG